MLDPSAGGWGCSGTTTTIECPSTCRWMGLRRHHAAAPMLDPSAGGWGCTGNNCCINARSICRWMGLQRHQLLHQCSIHLQVDGAALAPPPPSSVHPPA
eukprot:scaffold1713_cov395-Pavlova_lutheri.AAC.1